MFFCGELRIVLPIAPPVEPPEAALCLAQGFYMFFMFSDVILLVKKTAGGRTMPNTGVLHVYVFIRHFPEQEQLLDYCVIILS